MSLGIIITFDLLGVIVSFTLFFQRYRRYNAVFHMVTAADGAEAYYTLENNAARSEDAATAIALDRKTRKAWSGHAHHYVFDNSTDFEGKLKRVVERISKLVGLPSNLNRRSAKFLLKSIPDPKTFPEDVDYHSFRVEKVSRPLYSLFAGTCQADVIVF